MCTIETSLTENEVPCTDISMYTIATSLTENQSDDDHRRKRSRQQTAHPLRVERLIARYMLGAGVHPCHLHDGPG